VNKEVLVVDDAATVRMYHGGILEDAGFRVAQAANGYEALESAIERRFDLMVVDVNMPQMDGYALVAAVRRDGLNQSTPIIMISTESANVDAEQAYASGANVYLNKPAQPADLAGMARTLTGGT
jgi:two-component system, chemotaxis family, chemotaxis protein CheY